MMNIPVDWPQVPDLSGISLCTEGRVCQRFDTRCGLCLSGTHVSWKFRITVISPNLRGVEGTVATGGANKARLTRSIVAAI